MGEMWTTTDAAHCSEIIAWTGLPTPHVVPSIQVARRCIAQDLHARPLVQPSRGCHVKRRSLVLRQLGWCAVSAPNTRAGDNHVECRIRCRYSRKSHIVSQVHVAAGIHQQLQTGSLPASCALCGWGAPLLRPLGPNCTGQAICSAPHASTFQPWARVHELTWSRASSAAPASISARMHRVAPLTAFQCSGVIPA